MENKIIQAAKETFLKKGYKERITKLAEAKNMSMSALLVYLIEKEFESERN